MRLDEEGLVRWGRRLGETAEPPITIALSGRLGSGKSVLARAIGAGAGVDGPMPSPTFNLLLRYPARDRTEVVHLDLYRIDAPADLWEIGWADLGAAREIVLVEWADNAGSLLPPDYWKIDLSVPPGRPDLRDVEVVCVGEPSPLPGFPLTVSRPTRGTSATR